MKRNSGNWRKLAIVGGLILAGILPARADSQVEPQTCTFTNKRAEAAQSVTWAGTLYRSGTVLFTNCLLYADSLGLTVQTLTNVTVQVSVGSLTTNIDYTATVLSTNGGTWFKSVTVPDLASWTIQVKITDSLTNTYIYPAKVMTAEQSMF